MNEMDKLKHLLEHWIEHNDAHVKTYDEWAVKTKEMGKKELSGILDEITQESRKLTGLFKKALEIS